jgi:histidinol-phosphate phosphatase family protein
MERLLLQPRSSGKEVFVLLDRDGTVIEERHYLSRPEQVTFVPHAVEGLRELSRLGCGLVIVTNQSGIGRGFFTRSDLARIHGVVVEGLASQGVFLDAIYYCPHLPEEHCACRKPAPALAHAAAADFGFDLSRAFVIGDKPCDIDLGRNAGCTTVLVKSGYGAGFLQNGEVRPDHVADDLWAAARIIAKHLPVSLRDARGSSCPGRS